jgi:hypothetical protein
VCCGTKRLVEIRCPSDCTYLRASHTHPPAVERRQRERDLVFLWPRLEPLPATSQQLVIALQEAILTYRPSALPALEDRDVSEAAGSLAATLETAARGLIYEHAPASLPAQRLMAALKEQLRAATKEMGGSETERHAAQALRAIASAATEARTALDGGERAYLDLIERVGRRARDESGAAPVIEQSPKGGLIIP